MKVLGVDPYNNYKECWHDASQNLIPYHHVGLSRSTIDADYEIQN